MNQESSRNALLQGSRLPARRSAAARALALLPLLGLGSCTIVHGTGRDLPPQLRFDGLVEGYVGFGWPEADGLLRLDVLEGRSEGSLVYFELWRLLRLEVGLAGLAVGVGPFDLGLGVLAYEPAYPRYGWSEADGPLPDPDVIEWQGRAPGEPREPLEPLDPGPDAGPESDTAAEPVTPDGPAAPAGG